MKIGASTDGRGCKLQKQEKAAEIGDGAQVGP